MASGVKSICAISINYPEPAFVERGIFVENLVRDWQDMGISVDVIAPRSIPNIFRAIGTKKGKIRTSANCIERPIFASVSNKRLGPIDLNKGSRLFFLNSVKRAAKRLQVPDLYYGKFLMSGGMAAFAAGRLFDRPAFADLGESKLLDKMVSEERNLAKVLINDLSGIACVSERLIEEVLALGADQKKILYAPNTVDKERFYPMDQVQCRKELGISNSEFVVAFTGYFEKRKGPQRVLEAINLLNGSAKGIFFGRGEQKPSGKNVLFAGAVPNDELATWLNAADIFVLPTLAEGYCNAINEALACGLPVISSDIPDIRAQIPDNTAILVDPMDVKEISSSINMLYKDESKRKTYGRKSLAAIELLTSEARAEKIAAWLGEKIQ